MKLCLKGGYVMRKNSLIVCFIVILITALIVVFKVIDIDNKSTLTCIRENKDKVVFKIDDYQIKKIIINDKEMNSNQLKEYCSLDGAVCSHYIGLTLINKTIYEKRQDFLDKIKAFEEYESEFYSECHIGK